MSHTPPYIKTLKDALLITLEHKHLWVFGFFLAVFSYGTEINTLFSMLQRLPGRIILLKNARVFGIPEFILSLVSLAGLNPLLFWGAAGLIMIILVFVVYAQVSVILGTERAYRKKEVSVSIILAEGAEHFWSFLVTNIIFKLLSFIGLCLVVFVGAAVTGFHTTTSSIFMSFALIFSLIIYVLLSFLRRFSLLSLIHQRLGVLDAVKDSLRLFKKNWLVCIELAVLLFFIQFLAFAASLTLSFFIIFPYLLITPFLPLALAHLFGFIVLFVIILIFFIVGAWFGTYELACWTLLFNDLRGSLKKMGSWLARKLSICQI